MEFEELFIFDRKYKTVNSYSNGFQCLGFEQIFLVEW